MTAAVLLRSLAAAPTIAGFDIDNYKEPRNRAPCMGLAICLMPPTREINSCLNLELRAEKMCEIPNRRPHTRPKIGERFLKNLGPKPFFASGLQRLNQDRNKRHTRSPKP